MRKDLTTLGLRSTSWALTHNVIYIDNPVGTGKLHAKKVYVVQLNNKVKARPAVVAEWAKALPQIQVEAH